MTRIEDAPISLSESSPLKASAAPGAGATRGPNPTERATIAAAKDLLSTTTEDNRMEAHKRLAEVLADRGTAPADIGKELLKMGIDANALMSKHVDVSQVREFIGERVTEKRKEQQQAQLQGEINRYADAYIEATIEGNDQGATAALRGLNSKLQGVRDQAGEDAGNQIEAHFEGILEHLNSTNPSEQNEALVGGLFAAADQLKTADAEARAEEIRGSDEYKAIKGDVDAIIGIKDIMSSDDPMVNPELGIAREQANIATLQREKEEAQNGLEALALPGDEEPDTLDERRTNFERRIAEANDQIDQSQKAIADHETRLDFYESALESANQKLAQKMKGAGMSKEALTEMLSGAGMEEGKIAQLDKRDLQDKVDSLNGREALEQLPPKELTKITDELRKLVNDPSDQKAKAALVKLLNKNNIDPQELAKALKSTGVSGSIAEDPEVVDALLTGPELREALIDDVKGQGHNQAVFDAAQKLVAAGSDPAKKSEAMNELAKAMVKNKTKSDELPGLLKKMGMDQGDIDKISTREVEGARETESREQSDKRMQKMLKIAGIVACVATVVFGVALMAVGIGVCAANPVAMPFGIAIIGAGLVIALAGPTVGGMLYLDKEERKAQAAAKEEEDAKRKPFLSKPAPPVTPTPLSSSSAAQPGAGSGGAPGSSGVPSQTPPPSIRKLETELRSLAEKAQGAILKKASGEELTKEETQLLAAYNLKKEELEAARQSAELLSEQAASSSSAAATPPPAGSEASSSSNSARDPVQQAAFDNNSLSDAQLTSEISRLKEYLGNPMRKYTDVGKVTTLFRELDDLEGVLASRRGVLSSDKPSKPIAEMTIEELRDSIRDHNLREVAGYYGIKPGNWSFNPVSAESKGRSLEMQQRLNTLLESEISRLKTLVDSPASLQRNVGTLAKWHNDLRRLEAELAFQKGERIQDSSSIPINQMTVEELRKNIQDNRRRQEAALYNRVSGSRQTDFESPGKLEERTLEMQQRLSELLELESLRERSSGMQQRLAEAPGTRPASSSLGRAAEHIDALQRRLNELGSQRSREVERHKNRPDIPWTQEETSVLREFSRVEEELRLAKKGLRESQQAAAAASPPSPYADMSVEVLNRDIERRKTRLSEATTQSMDQDEIEEIRAELEELEAELRRRPIE